ncbi:UPF0146 family protein [Halorientalis pallida]|uniref:UPF0146 protein EAF64_19830 n=1 Tax=Halorientalis pallida TaxID=2479928 RepID=A0A498KZH8_9EURY|nr:UPF0146 family protein [Halorientalis pallida]RXK46330.1 hypothetical protein EAF64_19830 [Halorientalis pallida]
MSDARHAALVDRLATHDTLVEVGIGNRPAVAAALADRGCTVTATDVYDRETPASVHFVRDDVTDPDPAVYADADAVYALNLPPELHWPTRAVAREAGAPLLFTTLGGDPPLVPVTRDHLAGTGETLFVTDDGRPG